MRKTLAFIIKLILAYITTIAIAAVSGYGITGIEIILPCIFVLALIVYHKAYQRIESDRELQEEKRLKRDIICSLPVGILLAAGITVGAHFDIWNQTITSAGIKDLLYFVFIALFLSAAVLIMFGMLDKKSSDDNGNMTEKKTADGKERGIKKYVTAAAIMLVCWLPYYLVLFPGNIGSDTIEEINMCLGNIPWTNHHPVFFTMLIGIVIKLTSMTGSLTLAMAVFSALQMLAFSLTLAYIVMWLDKRSYEDKRNDRKRLVILAFFALCPVFPMFAIYLSKDLLFSCALVMLTLNLYDLVKAKNRKYMMTGVWSLLVMLLRNNGLIIVALIGVILLLVYRKDYRKILLSVAGPILIFIIFRILAATNLNISSQSFAESASVPLQQTGYVICGMEGDKIEGLTDEENELLSNIMPYERVREVYQLGYTDPLKFDESFDDEYFNEHSGEYMKVWLHMLPSHLPEYVNAYLAQTAGYWHYGETNTLCTQGVTENTLGIERIDVIEKITGISLFGVIEKLMLLVRKAPLLCILTSMAMQFYMAVLLLCSYIREKRYSQIIALLPVLLLWLTIMIATPAFCLFRYTFAMFILWPVFADELAGK